MTADESALLAAVAADPASDLPRLVYADWLDDHGQGVRAEFIRLQCEIAKLEVGPRAEVDCNWRLWKRQQDLLDDHLPELLGPAADLAAFRPVFRRGFLDEVTVPAGDFPAAAGPLLALPLPPGRLAVTEAAFELDAVLECGQPDALDRVTELHLTYHHGDPAELTDFRDGAEVRAAAGWPRLVALGLAGCQYGSAVRDWFTADAFPALRDLDLSGNDLTDADVVALLNVGLPQRLTRLALDGNPVGDQAAFELADRLGRVQTFRWLEFRRTRVTNAGQAALTAAFGSRCNLF